MITASIALAEDKLEIYFDYPSFEGDFYLSGLVSFPPGRLKSLKNIKIVSSKSEKEITSKITVLKKWPDGSVLNAEVMFVPELSDSYDYVIVYGENIIREKILSETAVLPTISFSVGGAPKTTEDMDISVGEINVRVDRSPGIFYYWHIIPVLLLVGLTYYRAKRVNRK